MNLNSGHSDTRAKCQRADMTGRDGAVGQTVVLVPVSGSLEKLGWDDALHEVTSSGIDKTAFGVSAIDESVDRSWISLNAS